MKKVLLISFLLFGIVLAGCTSNQNVIQLKQQENTLTQGTDDVGAGSSFNNTKVFPPDSKGEGIVCTMEYAPVCALIHVQGIKTQGETIQQTFSNRCRMNANKLAEFLYNGKCITE